MTTATLLLYLLLSGQESVLSATLARAEAAQPVDLAGLDTALLDLAQFLQERGRYHEAEVLYVRSNEIHQAADGRDSLGAALSLLRLGAIYRAQWRLDLAEAPTRRAVELLQSLTGPDSLAYAYGIANLASVLADQGQMARAEPVLRRAIFLMRKLDPSTVPSLEANLGLVYLREGELVQARALLEGAVEKEFSATTLAALAELAIAEGRWAEANFAIRQACDRTSERHPWRIGMLRLRALVEAHFGNFSAAIEDMRQSIALLEELAGGEAPTLGGFLEDYAAVLRQGKRKAEAKAVLRRAKSLK